MGHSNRFAHIIAGLFFFVGLAFGGQAFAQHGGGIEWYEWDVVVDPAGSAKTVAKMWYGDNGESVWQTVEKADLADMSKGVELQWIGNYDPPSSLAPNYTASTLTSSQTLSDVHEYKRPSDGSTDMVLDLSLEASCTTDCLLTDLDLLHFTDTELDLTVKPSGNIVSFPTATTFQAVAGDKMEVHQVDQAT